MDYPLSSSLHLLLLNLEDSHLNWLLNGNIQIMSAVHSKGRRSGLTKTGLHSFDVLLLTCLEEQWPSLQIKYYASAVGMALPLLLIRYLDTTDPSTTMILCNNLKTKKYMRG
jgi:hypothetical protein